MSNCVTEPKVASTLPDYARNAHGNLADQNRLVGQQHGANTALPENKSASVGAAATATPATSASAAAKVVDPAIALLTKHTCTACHAQDRKVVGPSFNDIAKKYPGKADYLASKIKSGGSGIWGAVTMPPQKAAEKDIKTIANWLAAGAAN
jgi:cytochrome c